MLFCCLKVFQKQFVGYFTDLILLDLNSGSGLKKSREVHNICFKKKNKYISNSKDSIMKKKSLLSSTKSYS